MSEQELIEVVNLPSERKQLEQFFIEFDPKGLDEVTAKIKAMAADLPADMSKKKNRDEVASFAYRIAKLKSAVEKEGAALSKEFKELPKKIDATRKQYKDALEALQHEVRQPVTDWEDAEKERVTTLERKLDWLNNWNDQLERAPSEIIKQRMAEVEAVELGEHWQEYETEAGRAKDAALTGLRDLLATTEKREAEQAELERLRKEAEEREQKDREARIAQEAAEKAKQEQAEALAKAQAEKELAEQRRIAAEKQAEQDRADAERKAKEAAERAAAQERQRIADEQAKADAERAAREADHEHKATINRAALAAIQSAGQLTDEQAKAVIVAIIKGQVPAVSIQY